MAAWRFVRRAILVILVTWFAARYAEGSALSTVAGPNIRAAVVVTHLQTGGPPPCKQSVLHASRPTAP
jgi:hypothetical protein